MTDKTGPIVDWSRWQGWRGRVTYWKGWLAWQAYRSLPVGYLPYWAYGWLLPSVGDYAEWDNAIARMNEETTLSAREGK